MADDSLTDANLNVDAVSVRQTLSLQEPNQAISNLIVSPFNTGKKAAKEKKSRKKSKKSKSKRKSKKKGQGNGKGNKKGKGNESNSNSNQTDQLKKKKRILKRKKPSKSKPKSPSKESHSNSNAKSKNPSNSKSHSVSSSNSSHGYNTRSKVNVEKGMAEHDRRSAAKKFFDYFTANKCRLLMKHKSKSFSDSTIKIEPYDPIDIQSIICQMQKVTTTQKEKPIFILDHNADVRICKDVTMWRWARLIQNHFYSGTRPFWLPESISQGHPFAKIHFYTFDIYQNQSSFIAIDSMIRDANSNKEGLRILHANNPTILHKELSHLQDEPMAYRYFVFPKKTEELRKYIRMTWTDYDKYPCSALLQPEAELFETMRLWRAKEVIRAFGRYIGRFQGRMLPNTTPIIRDVMQPEMYHRNNENKKHQRTIIRGGPPNKRRKLNDDEDLKLYTLPKNQETNGNDSNSISKIQTEDSENIPIPTEEAKSANENEQNQDEDDDDSVMNGMTVGAMDMDDEEEQNGTDTDKIGNLMNANENAFEIENDDNNGNAANENAIQIDSQKKKGKGKNDSDGKEKNLNAMQIDSPKEKDSEGDNDSDGNEENTDSKANENAMQIDSQKEKDSEREHESHANDKNTNSQANANAMQIDSPKKKIKEKNAISNENSMEIDKQKKKSKAKNDSDGQQINANVIANENSMEMDKQKKKCKGKNVSEVKENKANRNDNEIDKTKNDSHGNEKNTNSKANENTIPIDTQKKMSKAKNDSESKENNANTNENEIVKQTENANQKAMDTDQNVNLKKKVCDPLTEQENDSDLTEDEEEDSVVNLGKVQNQKEEKEEDESDSDDADFSADVKQIENQKSIMAIIKTKSTFAGVVPLTLFGLEFSSPSSNENNEFILELLKNSDSPLIRFFMDHFYLEGKYTLYFLPLICLIYDINVELFDYRQSDQFKCLGKFGDSKNGSYWFFLKDTLNLEITRIAVPEAPVLLVTPKNEKLVFEKILKFGDFLAEVNVNIDGAVNPKLFLNSLNDFCETKKKENLDIQNQRAQQQAANLNLPVLQ